MSCFTGYTAGEAADLVKNAITVGAVPMSVAGNITGLVTGGASAVTMHKCVDDAKDMAVSAIKSVIINA